MTQYKCPEKKSNSKRSTYYEKILYFLRGTHKEEYHVQHDKKCVNIVPAISKICFRTNSYDSNKKLSEEKPDKDGIENICDVIAIEEEDYSVNTAKKSIKTDNNVKEPVLDNIFKPDSLVDSLPEVDPDLEVIKFRGKHDRIIQNNL